MYQNLIYIKVVINIVKKVGISTGVIATMEFIPKISLLVFGFTIVVVSFQRFESILTKIYAKISN